MINFFRFLIRRFFTRKIKNIEANHSACLVCPHVLRDERPVRVIIHHHDRTWQAVCGQKDHSDDGHDWRMVGVNHLFDRQADLIPLSALLPEQIAEWHDGEWRVSPFDEDATD
jgi:hypothetical protein